MIKAVLVIALALGANAFTPATVRSARNAVRMSAESSRREFAGKLAAGVAAVGAAGPAYATAGDGAKFSIFGLLGNGESYSEGAAFGTDQSQGVYSAYSPYSSIGESSLSGVKADEYKAKAKAKLAESEKRLKSDVIPKAIGKKAWSEVTTELTRQVYTLRSSIKTLGGDSAKATEFYKSIEALNLACVRKNQDVAKAAYEKAVADFDAVKATI